VFGLIGDKDSFSEATAYGTDQSSPLYSPYSVYGESGPDSLYDPKNPEYTQRKKAVLVESKKRLEKLPSYISKKAWFEVSDELGRYMYETRSAVKGLAQTPAQKKAASAFFRAIEKTDLASRRREGDAALAAATDSLAKLEAFTGTL